MKIRKVLSFVQKEKCPLKYSNRVLYVCFIEKLIILGLNDICGGMNASVVVELLWKSCKL